MSEKTLADYLIELGKEGIIGKYFFLSQTRSFKVLSFDKQGIQYLVRVDFVNKNPQLPQRESYTLSYLLNSIEVPLDSEQ
jgi:hypothetical protein